MFCHLVSNDLEIKINKKNTISWLCFCLWTWSISSIKVCCVNSTLKLELTKCNTASSSFHFSTSHQVNFVLSKTQVYYSQCLPFSGAVWSTNNRRVQWSLSNEIISSIKNHNNAAAEMYLVFSWFISGRQSYTLSLWTCCSAWARFTSHA